MALSCAPCSEQVLCRHEEHVVLLSPLATVFKSLLQTNVTKFGLVVQTVTVRGKSSALRAELEPLHTRYFICSRWSYSLVFEHVQC